WKHLEEEMGTADILSCHSPAVKSLPNSAACTSLHVGTRRRRCGKFRVAEASDKVVVDHADGLHEGVTDCGADEREAAAAQILAHGVGLVCPGGNPLQFLPGVLLRVLANEAPDVLVEGAERFLHGQE